MKLFIKPFLNYLKKAITLGIDADIIEGTLVLAVSVALAGKVLFEETWSWSLPDNSVEADPNVMETITPPGGTTFHRVSPIRLPKVRINPRLVPKLVSGKANIADRVLK